MVVITESYSINIIITTCLLLGYHFRRVCVLSHQSSVLRHFQNGTAYWNYRPRFGMIIFAYLCGSISSALFWYALLDCRTRATAALGSGRGTPLLLRIGGRGRRHGTDFRRPAKKVCCPSPQRCCNRALGVSSLLAGVDRNHTACLGHLAGIFGFKGGKERCLLASNCAGGWRLNRRDGRNGCNRVLLKRLTDALGAIVSHLVAPHVLVVRKSQFPLPVSMLSCSSASSP